MVNFLKDKVLDRRTLNTDVLAGVLVLFIGWAGLQVYGVIQTVQATEQKQAETCLEVSENALAIQENRRTEDERQAKTDESIAQINERLAAIETGIQYIKEGVDRIVNQGGE